MTARGFIESLASRTVGTLPPVVVRPAISPDMLPETFSSVGSPAPAIPRSLRLGSARHPELPMRRSADKTPATFDTKLQKSSSVTARENNDALPSGRVEDKLSTSTPTGVPQIRHVDPSPPQQPPAEIKGEYKETLKGMQDEKKPLISPAGVPEIPASARPPTAPDNSKEILRRQEDNADDDDLVVVVTAPVSSPVTQVKGPTLQPGAELAKDTAVVTSINPDEKRMEKEEVHTISTTLHDNPHRADFIQQGLMGARSARQMQDQAYKHDQDTVTINIGRIEVRAVFPQKQGPPAKGQSGISLSQYLKLRSEGKM